MNGIYLVDKPSDMTSFGVVARVRRLSGMKCGHSGTLDPMATGLLPVMVGKATKLCELFTEGEKEYIGTLRFGLLTDTGDITGEILQERAGAPTKEQLLAALPCFLGKITQRPPIYSAIKVDGVPLYRHARAGRQIEVPEREVEILRLELLDYDEQKGEAVLAVECSKGTYIRTLFMDLAAKCGCLGTMAALRRTKVGRFTIEESIPLEQLMEQLEQGNSPAFLPLEEALSFLPQYEPPEFFATLLKNGCAVDVKKLRGLPQSLCTVYSGGALLGLGEIIEKDGETCFKVVTHL